MPNTLINIKNLTVGFQSEKKLDLAVKNVSFPIYRGETLALVGESGGGKSITALAMLQLLPAAARIGSDSQILFAGKDLLQTPEIEMRKIRGKHLGMIFQEAMTALNPVLTIGHQIDEVLRCHFKLKKSQRRQRMLLLLHEVGLPNPEQCARSYPHQLSGGMRQRAMIAIALAAEPELLIADEPTTALDVTLQAQILALLKQLQAKTGMSILFVTHDLGVVAEIAHRVAVIYQGEIVEIATVADFFSQPQHPYSKKLFAAIPSWEKRQRPPITTEDKKPLLSVQDLRTYFPIQKGIFKKTVGYIKSVDDVSFNLYRGQTLALVGESGSGKTTAGKSILHLIKPTAGRIYFEGTDLAAISSAAMRPLREKLQIIFQDPYAAMNPRMNIGDIIAEGMLAQKIVKNPAQRTRRIEELLHLVGLPTDSQTRYPHEFSGGQRQRICIARSLALDPELIICDEPTSSLDVSVQLQILELLQRLQQELGISYLLITHNFAVVAYLADEVAVMHQGKIVEHGAVQQILNHPQHPYTQQLLASIPKIPSSF